MTKIKFLFEDEDSLELCESSQWSAWDREFSIRDLLDHYKIKVGIIEYKVPGPVKEELYIDNIFVDKAKYDKKFFEFIGSGKSKCTLKIRMVSELIKDLSDDELNRPIIQYLNNNNIERACWTIKKKHQPININNNFNHYHVYEYVGYMYHTKQCNIDICDLVTHKVHTELYSVTLTKRYGNYPITAIILSNDNTKCIFFGTIKLPVISNRRTILDVFINNINKANIKKIITIKSFELNIYWFSRRRKSFRSPEYDQKIVPILDDNNFVLDFFCNNGKESHNKESHNYAWGLDENRYVIMLKPLRSKEFYHIIKILPIDVSDIIYEYIDFENIPTMNDVFEPSVIYCVTMQ